jgi:hypothetical protein
METVKKLHVFALSILMVFAVANLASARELTTTGLEEAFVDAVGKCGPSSVVAGALGKAGDPSVRRALRNALIIEAADAAAGNTTNKALESCIQKELKDRGYTDTQMAVLPECVRSDWPDPFTSLGQCVKNRARAAAAQK